MRAAILIALALTGCTALETKTAQINVGDSKATVAKALGPAADRQINADNEAWQYCKTGGFGYHDNRIIWFHRGVVTGITSYRTENMGGCKGGLREIRWLEAPPLPDTIIELRQR